MIDVISTPSSRPFASNMPHRIFEIHELTRLISFHLAQTDHQATLSLACTCRLLEVPALSSLWELRPRSLSALINVSPIVNKKVRD